MAPPSTSTLLPSTEATLTSKDNNIVTCIEPPSDTRPYPRKYTLKRSTSLRRVDVQVDGTTLAAEKDIDGNTHATLTPSFAPTDISRRVTFGPSDPGRRRTHLPSEKYELFVTAEIPLALSSKAESENQSDFPKSVHAVLGRWERGAKAVYGSEVEYLPQSACLSDLSNSIRDPSPPRRDQVHGRDGPRPQWAVRSEWSFQLHGSDLRSTNTYDEKELTASTAPGKARAHGGPSTSNRHTDPARLGRFRNSNQTTRDQSELANLPAWLAQDPPPRAPSPPALFTTELSSPFSRPRNCPRQEGHPKSHVTTTARHNKPRRRVDVLRSAEAIGLDSKAQAENTDSSPTVTKWLERQYPLQPSKSDEEEWAWTEQVPAPAPGGSVVDLADEEEEWEWKSE